MNFFKSFSLCSLCLLLISGMASAQKDSTKKQPVQQVEIVTFKPGTSEANQHLVDNSFRKAANQLPIVHTFTSMVANDSQNGPQVKHVYITTFNSKGDLYTYNASPEHQAVFKTHAVYIDSISTVNFPITK